MGWRVEKQKRKMHRVSSGLAAKQHTDMRRAGSRVLRRRPRRYTEAEGKEMCRWKNLGLEARQGWQEQARRAAGPRELGLRPGAEQQAALAPLLPGPFSPQAATQHRPSRMLL